MRQEQQVQLVCDKLDAVHNWAVEELDMDYATLVGIFHMKTTYLTMQAREEEDDCDGPIGTSK